jgi:uncharacterized YigZ family protein
MRAPRPAAGWRADGETEIQRSRFLATAARVDSEAEARALFAAVRQRYPDARHHCTAFMVEVEAGPPISRSSDDGEPAGTAGRPMLSVLTGAGLVNVAVVVTRYFGGIKLGTGGLTRAYGGAVSDVLAGVPRVIPVEQPLWHLRVGLGEVGRIADDVRRRGVAVVGQRYEAQAAVLELAFPAEVDAVGLLAQVSQGTGVATLVGQQTVEVPDGG